MKRKLLAVLLSCSVVLGMAACGSSTNADTDAGSESETKTTESSDGEIRLFNSKVEIGPQLEKVAEQYSEETGLLPRTINPSIFHPVSQYMISVILSEIYSII